MTWSSISNGARSRERRRPGEKERAAAAIGVVGVARVIPMRRSPTDTIAFPDRSCGPGLLQGCRIALEFYRAWPAYRCRGPLLG